MYIKRSQNELCVWRRKLSISKKGKMENNVLKQFFKAHTTTLVTKLNQAKGSYTEFVANNPEITEQIERTAKAAAYLYDAFSKNYDNSIFITELVSSACNIFAYVNSHIRKTKDFFTLTDSNSFTEKIKQVLTIIEFSQAFIEMAAVKTGGPGARWAVISIICLVKVILRCALLLIFQGGILQSPLSQLTNQAVVSKVGNRQPTEAEPNIFYVGPRSGIKIRTLDSCNVDQSCQKVNVNIPPTVLNRQQIIGELLYSIRPMLHLLSTGLFGTKSFVPWTASLVADASSHALLHTDKNNKKGKLNATEEREMQRRYANMLLYLLRSPVYDMTTGPKLLQIFAFMSKKIPLARYILEPLSSYLPVWQRVYFYTWAD